MPTIATANMSRTSSALFFDLGAKAFENQRDDASAASAAVEQRLDHYIAGDRAHAFARGERLFRQCFMYEGDPSTRVAVWMGAVRCMERHAPDYALARDMAPLTQLPSEDALATFLNAAVAHLGSTLSAQHLRRYVSAPLLGFLQSLDFASVWALGLCSGAAPHEVQQLHKLLHHPAIDAALQLDYALFFQLMEADVDSASDDASSAEVASGSESQDESDLVSTAGSCTGDAGDAGDAAESDLAGAQLDAAAPAPSVLESTLLRLRFDKAVCRDAEEALVKEGATEETLQQLRPILEKTAKDYVRHVAEKIVASMPAEEAQNLAALVRQPLCARWLCEPADAVYGALGPVLSLVREGAMARARKRVRDDATDCTDEVRFDGH